MPCTENFIFFETTVTGTQPVIPPEDETRFLYEKRQLIFSGNTNVLL